MFEGRSVPVQRVLKLYWWVLVLLWSIGVAGAQDLIVNAQGDSLNCRIKGSDAKGVYYRALAGDEIQNRYILKHDIIFMKEDFFAKDFLGDRTRREFRDRDVLRISLQGGLGWHEFRRDRDLPEWLQDHEEGLRRGTVLALDMDVFFSRHWGIRGSFRTISTSHTTDQVHYHFPDGSVQIGTLSDNVMVRSIGLSIVNMSPTPLKGLYLISSLGVEHLSYQNNVIILEPFELVGETFGARFMIGADQRITERWGVSLAFCRTVARLTDLKAEGDPLDRNLLGIGGSSLDLRRLDVTAGLVYIH